MVNMSQQTAQRYLRYLKAGNRSGSTIYDYGRTFERFFSQYDSLDTDNVEAFLASCNAPSTQLKYRIQLRGLAAFGKTTAVDWDQIPKPKVYLEPPKVVRPQHSTIIYRWLAARDRRKGSQLSVAYRLILHTGLRIGELTTLSTSSILHDDNGMPYIRVSKALGRSHSKSGRDIPLDRVARRLVARYSLPLAIRERTFNRMLNRACKETRISQTYSAHCLRKTCLTRWHEAGMDLKTIADIAGHSSTDTLAHYLERSPESLRRKMMRALRKMEE